MGVRVGMPVLTLHYSLRSLEGEVRRLLPEAELRYGDTMSYVNGVRIKGDVEVMAFLAALAEARRGRA